MNAIVSSTDLHQRTKRYPERKKQTKDGKVPFYLLSKIAELRKRLPQSTRIDKNFISTKYSEEEYTDNLS